MVKTAPAFLAALLSAVPARAAFDENGFNARGVAMGGAFTAVTDDPAAMASNPATIGQLRRVSAQTNYLRQFHIPAGEVDQDVVDAAVVVPVDQELLRGGVGLSWVYTFQKLYSIDRTAALTYATRGFREYEDGGLELGSTLKILARNFNEAGGATKATMDLGLLYRFKERYALGLSVLNFNGPTFRGKHIDDRVPATLKVGFVESVRGLTLAFDFSKREPSGPHPGSVSLASGFEYWWATPRWGRFATRTGINIGDQDKTWSGGIGWRVLGGQLDYALTVPIQGTSRAGHAVSISFRFGESDPEREYEKLISEEMSYRRDLTESLEAGEVKQWKYASELGRMRAELDELKRDLAEKILSEREARARLQELAERHRRTMDAIQKERDAARLRAQRTPQDRFREDWEAYLKLKREGAPEAVLEDRIKSLLRQYKDSGADLGEANLELQRLLRNR